MIIHNVEQGSPEWFAVRAGIPTGSMFSNLVTSKGEPSKSLDGYAITLAGEKYAGKSLDSFQGNPWTDRGTEFEDAARATYEIMNDVEVHQAGFITDDDHTYGVSPDGLVGNGGLAEFKCLKAENHIKAILYYKKYGRCPTDYVQQTQGQIMGAEREWCDLVFYHPDLPILIIRQTRDNGFIELLKEQIAIVNQKRDEILAQIKGE